MVCPVLAFAAEPTAARVVLAVLSQGRVHLIYQVAGQSGVALLTRALVQRHEATHRKRVGPQVALWWALRAEPGGAPAPRGETSDRVRALLASAAHNGYLLAAIRMF